MNSTDALRRARGTRGSGQGGTPFRARYGPNQDKTPKMKFEAHELLYTFPLGTMIIRAVD
jgi:hypothetical protein